MNVSIDAMTLVSRAAMGEHEAVVAMPVRLIEAIRPVGHGHPPSVGARGRTRTNERGRA